MGLGPSNLVILRADEDIRRLEWSDIEEQLAFFRQWDMEDVSAAIVKFKGLKTSLDKTRPPVTGDDAIDLLARRTNWAEFFTICFQVDVARNLKLEARKRAVWHPSCQNFAMLPDHEALEAYDEYILGDTVRPAFENYDNDEHTDDEESEKDSEEDDEVNSEDGSVASKVEELEGDNVPDGEPMQELLGSQTEEGEEEAPGVQTEEVEEDESSQAIVSGGAPGDTVEDGDGDSAMDSIEGSIKSIKSGSAGSARSKGNAQDGSSFKYENGRFVGAEGAEELRVESKQIPWQFDPSKYSPIFFGFSTRTIAEQRGEEEAKEATREKKELEIVRRMLQKRREEIEVIREEQGERRVQRGKRVEKLKAEHAKAAKARGIELKTAKKMMAKNQFKAFERMFQADESAAMQANEAELDELNDHNTGIYTTEELLMTKLVASAVAAEEAQSIDRPSGERLEIDGRADLSRCILELDAACKELEDAQQRLDMSREESLQAKDGGSAHDRSILIHMEQMVQHGESAVDAALKSVDEAEVVLSRAARRRSKEAKILPLYKPLASSMEDTDFSAPLIQVVVALVVACRDTFAEKLRVLATLFDLDNDQWLSQVELTNMLFHVSRVMLGIGYFKSNISEEEAESAVMRCLHDMSVTSEQMPQDGLTLFESKQYIKSLVSRSPYLSSLFGADFKFGELSSYQRQATPCVKQFEMGLIALPDLRYHYARTAVRYRPLLSSDSKLVIHERAFGMGADDPLKPDYSRFLPTKASRNISNVVPLEHGHIANILVFRHQVLTKAAVQVQNYYRCLQSRRKAEFQARKMSFLRARAVALDEARKAVEAEFEAKESLEGTAKMKWDSKIRLRQSKLAAAGTPAERSAVLAMYLDEAIVLKEKQVKERFQELAEQRGFAEPVSVDEEMNEEASIMHRLHLDKIFGEEKPEILDGELLTPRAAEQPEEESDADQLARRAAEAVASKQKAASQLMGDDPSSTTTVRRKNMLLGNFPRDLYYTGMTDEENKLRNQLSIPNPSHDDIYRRLRGIDSTFTELKTEDFLRELPSKSLIALYVRNLARSGDLQHDLAAHFRIVRNSPEIANIMLQICDTDLEAGILTRAAWFMKDSQEGVLKAVETLETDVGTRKAQQKVEKAIRASRADSEVAVAELWEREGAELTKRNDAASELETSMEKLAKKLRTSKLAITELSKRRMYMKKHLKHMKGEVVEAEVNPEVRNDWMKRYEAAMAAPEDTNEQSSAKYAELSAVGMEFLDAATRGAITVVDELFLPLDKKTIQAVSESPVDGRCSEAGRGVTGVRYKYEAFNIRFKVWIDDHGIFNGSDENSAKAAGNDLRASLEYIKCHLGDINFPLQATVDYHGFRVLCVAKLPIELFSFAENGDVRKSGEDMVSGTVDRGETVSNGNRVVDNRLAEASRKLNLTRHAVKGTKDILNKYLYSSVDMRVFKDRHAQFGALNFWRVFPGEDANLTPHLSLAPRGQSIFWRLLRPELVKTNHVSEARISNLIKEINERYSLSVNIGGEFLLGDDALSEENTQLFASLSPDVKQKIIDTRALPAGPVKVPLSPDANCMVEYGCPEWEPHIWAVRDATKRLITELIPKMAHSLATRELEGKHPNSGYGVNLSADMHRQGINVRHMGLLRSYFWRTVEGKVNIATNSNKLVAHSDLRDQVRRGDFLILQTDAQQVRIRAGLPTKLYQVSMDSNDDHSGHSLTLTEEVTELSVNEVSLRVGKLEEQANSKEMRLLLLAEMIARTAKNVLRLLLRTAARTMKTTSGRLHSFIVVELLNMMTGAHNLSDDFWSNQLFYAVRSRYGRCALEEVERVNLRKNSEVCLIYIMNRVIKMTGTRLSRTCMAQFNEEPVAFKFTVADMEVGCAAIRVKHNISVLDFARAHLLSTQALERRSHSYEQLVINDGAVLYLKLNERRGSRVAFNRGTGGMPLCGSYGRAVKMESTGPIANDDINRAVLFDPHGTSNANGCRIDFKYSAEVAPMDDDESWCVECWCRCMGGESTQRVVVMCGRYALVASREDKWQLEVYSRVADIAVRGHAVEIGAWVHLVASYDGTVARLWINSEMAAQVEVRPMVIKEVDHKLVEYEETREKLIAAENKARDLCKRQTEEQAAAFFRTKEGGERIKAAANTLCEHAEFKFKMDARAVEKGLKLLSKQDAKVTAKQEYREKLYLKNVGVVAEFHRKRMEEHVESLAVEEDEAKARAMKPLRIGAACSSKRNAGGRFHFHGEVSHLAVYVRSKVLTTDRIRAHYVSGIQQRSVQADRISALASGLFQSALEFAPDDHIVLRMYANSLCQALVFDSANEDAVRRNKRKVLEAISVFSEYENPDALAEVLRRLPNDYKYAELGCAAFDAIMKLDPEYFTLNSYMTLKELSVIPSKFSLTVPGSPPSYMRVAADIYRKVLSEPVLSMIYGEEMLRWAASLECSEVICGLVAQAESDGDKRIMDLHVYHPITDIGDADLESIADHRRLTLAFNLTQCSNITDEGVFQASRRCTSLQALTLDGCSQLTDKTLESLKKCTPGMHLLSMQKCHQMSEAALCSLFHSCTKLRVINLNLCKQVSDDTLSTLASCCKQIELLHVSMCHAITDTGLYSFAMNANAKPFRSLDVSYCRSLSDDSIEVVAKKLTHITYLSLRGCSRVTDISAKAVTHNLWQLTDLDLEDLFLITDDCFFFDHENDGRRAADAQMLTNIINLNVSECNGLTDRAIGGISTRCSKLRGFHGAGLQLLTSAGFELFIREPTALAARGEFLHVLNLSFVPTLSDESLSIVAESCPILETVNLAGCVLLSDKGVTLLASKCGHVKKLGLSHMKRVTDASICSCADYLWLEDLDISGCSKITDDGIEVLCLEFAGMVRLDLSSCSKLTNSALESIMRHADYLRWLKVATVQFITDDAINALQLKNPNLKIVTTNFVNDDDGKPLDRIELV